MSNLAVTNQKSSDLFWFLCLVAWSAGAVLRVGGSVSGSCEHVFDDVRRASCALGVLVSGRGVAGGWSAADGGGTRLRGDGADRSQLGFRVDGVRGVGPCVGA